MVVVGLYVIGILACVYHLANGLWTMGITWGVWTSPKAQQRASVACTLFGVILAGISLSGLWGMYQVGQGEALEAAREVEDRMYQHRLESGELEPNEHKRSP